MVLEKTISKEYHRITDITQGGNKESAINAVILRNYNDGRHGGWNNYSCYEGQNKGTYVQKHSKMNSKE